MTLITKKAASTSASLLLLATLAPGCMLSDDAEFVSPDQAASATGSAASLETADGTADDKSQDEFTNLSNGDELSPGALSDENNQFIIDQETWQKIQVYAETALRLPIDEPTMRLVLERDPAESFTDFVPLLTAYQATHAHAVDWDQNILPTSVELAVDISNYADKAGIYYGPLQQAIAAVVADSSDVGSRALVEALLNDLAADAVEYEAAALEVQNDLNAFAVQLNSDRGALSTLVTEYQQSHGATGEEVEELREREAEIDALIDQLRDDYAHAVKVAATTPTYAWVGPPGLICAATVAGIYGSQATEILRQINDLEDQLNALGTDIRQRERLRRSLAYATESVTEIEDAVAQAIPAVATIRGHWQSMHGDLAQIVTTMRDDLPTAIPLLQQLQVNLALSEWQSVGDKAEGYVLNAYISVEE
ncbi:hypothetical protein Hoch_1399 [Haliangium ochraceum DSM 14365]|uniref:Uncharacterized protein n=2 Tax=Haliangium ochraceum TaxID=80816 RepID=D0LUR3_HALO1|nr:hypothetical protein Hoch_1399 [Haliangium ochraceum DSM 14365]